MTRSPIQPRGAGLTVIRVGPGFFARNYNWKWKLGALCLLGVAAVIAYPSPVSAQTQTGHTELVTDHVDRAEGGKEFGDFVVVPIPIVNPTFGNGLAVGGAYLYKFDEGSQTSFTGGGGFYTDSKSWGAVAFAGAGQVAENFGDYNTDDLLPRAGIGARFMLSEKNRLNLSVDYAIGKDTSALYFYVAESF